MKKGSSRWTLHRDTQTRSHLGREGAQLVNPRAGGISIKENEPVIKVDCKLEKREEAACERGDEAEIKRGKSFGGGVTRKKI